MEEKSFRYPVGWVLSSSGSVVDPDESSSAIEVVADDHAVLAIECWFKGCGWVRPLAV